MRLEYSPDKIKSLSKPLVYSRTWNIQPVKQLQEISLNVRRRLAFPFDNFYVEKTAFGFTCRNVKQRHY